MSLLKFKKEEGWIAFYLNAIKNRLRVDLNLSDLSDKQEARNNLELIGDNNHTHYHDDRYIPLIDAVRTDLDQYKTSVSSGTIEIAGDAEAKQVFNAGGNTLLSVSVKQSQHATNADEARHATLADNATLSTTTLNVPYGDKGGNIWIQGI